MEGSVCLGKLDGAEILVKKLGKIKVDDKYLSGMKLITKFLAGNSL